MNFSPRFLVSIFAALSLAASAFALPGAVGYSPGTKIMQGNQPFLSGAEVNLLDPKNPYYLVITSPANANYPQTVRISVESLDSSPTGTGSGRPAGISSDTAKGFVSTSFAGFTTSLPDDPMVILPTVVGGAGAATFTTTTVTFTGGGQKAVVKVAVNVPRNPVGGPDNYVGDYWWKLTAVDWTGAGTNNGATINATVLPPEEPTEPKIVPEITNLLPVSGTHYSYDPSVGPVSFDISFDVNVPQGGDALQTVTLRINGVPHGDWTAAGGQTSFHGRITSPNLTAVRDYLIEVTAQNNDGLDTKSATITVDSAAPPPGVTIAYPAPNSDYNLFAPAPTVNVPVSFTAKVPDGSGTVIHRIAAKLNGDSYDPSFPPTSHLDTPEVKGSVQLDLTTNGHYTLDITAYNEFGGNFTQSTDFWINRIESPVRQEILAFENAKFEVKVSGRPSYTYQWERQAGGSGPFVPLTNSAPYSGTDTATLLITGATRLLNGDNYRCTVTGFHGGSFSSDPAALIVNKLRPTITWSPAGFVYGTALSDAAGGQLTATASTGGNFVYSPHAGEVLVAGPQTLQTVFTPVDSMNYDGATASRPIQVEKARLDVTASSTSMVYGALSLPPLSYMLDASDFVNGDSANVVTGAAKLSTAVTSSTVPGAYDINIAQDSLSAANYNFYFAKGTLTVTKAELTVRASSPSRVYGDPNDLSFTTSGHVAGDSDATAFTGTPSLATDAGSTSPVGVYDVTISAGSLVSTKYTFKFEAGRLTVTRAPLTVIANDASMVVGGALPDFSATITGFKNGETRSVVSGTPAITTSALSSSPAGTYPITPTVGSLTAANYSFERFVDGSLTIGESTPACGVALVYHAAVLNGQALIRGSLKIMTGEKMALDGQAWITDNLYLPGNPTVKLTGQSIIGSRVADAGGSTAPSKYTLSLNGNAAIGTLVTQSNPVAILPIATPPLSLGTRDVTIKDSSDSLGNPATIRDFTVNGNAGAVTLPPGTYRDVTVTGNSILVLTTGTYNIREMKISGAQEIRVTGAVVVNVAKDVKLSGKWGATADPSLVHLNIAAGGLTLTGNGRFYGFVNAPAGEVRLTGLQLLKGGVIADELTVTGQGTIELCDTP